jgi:hypothetical protein
VGTWIGFTAEANDFYRIVIKNQGGLIAHSFAGEQPEVYKIDAWSLKRPARVYIKTSGISKGARSIRIEGNVVVSHLQLKFSAADGGWWQNVAFYHENTIKSNFTSLEKSMDSKMALLPPRNGSTK